LSLELHWRFSFGDAPPSSVNSFASLRNKAVENISRGSKAPRVRVYSCEKYVIKSFLKGYAMTNTQISASETQKQDLPLPAPQQNESAAKPGSDKTAEPQQK